jgi:hypothetical protein
MCDHDPGRSALLSPRLASFFLTSIAAVPLQIIGEMQGQGAQPGSADARLRRVMTRRLEACRPSSSFETRARPFEFAKPHPRALLRRRTAEPAARRRTVFRRLQYGLHTACQGRRVAIRPIICSRNTPGRRSFRFRVRRHRRRYERPPSVSYRANVGQELLSLVLGHFALRVR